VAGYRGETCCSRRILGVYVERQGSGHSSDAPKSGGWVRGARGGRVGSTKVVMGQVLGGGEMSSGRSKNAFVFDFLYAFGRLVGDIGWFSV
jgi:hypothetical protein